MGAKDEAARTASAGGVAAAQAAVTPPADGHATAAAVVVESSGRRGSGTAAVPPPPRPEDAALDDCDPMAWRLPLLCKDCNRRFDVPYRHFQAGVVFHCPHCHGSFVPKRPMCMAVDAAFEDFFTRRRAARDELARLPNDDAQWREQQAHDHAVFRAQLERLADEMRPAGKMVRKGWLAGMFS